MHYFNRTIMIIFLKINVKIKGIAKSISKTKNLPSPDFETIANTPIKSPMINA